jgi:hypothetical protein
MVDERVCNLVVRAGLCVIAVVAGKEKEECRIDVAVPGLGAAGLIG